MKNQNGFKSKKGFTLLEVIIAIGILSMILIASYSLTISGMRVYEMNNGAIKGQNAMRLTLTRISKDIRSLPESNSYNQIVFTVDSTSNTKTLAIGPYIRYQFNSSTGFIKRTEQSGSASGPAVTIEDMLTEGVIDFIVVKNDILKNEISIKIEGTNVKEVIESKITFRDVV